MRSIVKNSLVGAGIGVALLLAGAPASAIASSPSPGGIRISPATLTLSLPAGKQQQQANFSITNLYTNPVTLRFSVSQSVPTPGAATSAAQQVSTALSEATIQPGATTQQTVSLADSPKLAPGSQQLELIITQTNPASSVVSVVPSIRMPLIVVKEAGAVQQLGIGPLAAPTFAVDLPKSSHLTITNTGNVVSIPHGYVSVIDSRGREVGKGVLNTASTAVAPGGNLRLSTPITALGHSWIPGRYQLLVSYGAGGGQTAHVTTTSFWYFPVWQMVLVLLLASMAYTAWLIVREWARLRRLRRQQAAAIASTPALTAADEGAA